MPAMPPAISPPNQKNTNNTPNGQPARPRFLAFWLIELQSLIRKKISSTMTPRWGEALNRAEYWLRPPTLYFVRNWFVEASPRIRKNPAYVGSIMFTIQINKMNEA